MRIKKIEMREVEETIFACDVCGKEETKEDKIVGVNWENYSDNNHRLIHKSCVEHVLKPIFIARNSVEVTPE